MKKVTPLKVAVAILGLVAGIAVSSAASATETPDQETALYVYKKLDANAPASWENSGPQTYIAHKAGTDWYTTFPGNLPDFVCGPGWGAQQDQGTAGTDWAGAVIEYPNATIGWPPITAAKHTDLSELVTVPDCEPTRSVEATSSVDCTGLVTATTVNYENGVEVSRETTSTFDPTLETCPLNENG